MAPQAGVHTIHAIQTGTSSFDYSTNETNFTLGLTDLSLRLRRRSLVVLLTDFEDTVTAELMVENLQRMIRQHLVIFVTLRDGGLQDIAEAEPRSTGRLLRSVAARDLLTEREVVLKRLRRLGVHTVEALPDQVSSDLLNRYLDIKRRELL